MQYANGHNATMRHDQIMDQQKRGAAESYGRGQGSTQAGGRAVGGELEEGGIDLLGHRSVHRATSKNILNNPELYTQKWLK